MDIGQAALSVVSKTERQRHLMLCPDCPQGGPRVGWRGNPEADIVIVGEGPGNREIIKGVPFSGQSGELLQEALPEGVVLDRDCLVLNSIQCFFHLQNKDKTRISQAVAACRPNVQGILKEHPRKVIITLGNWAAESILGEYNFKITQRRGEELVALVGDLPVPVIPTYHPAFLLRGGGHLPTFKDDLKKAVSIARGTFVKKFKVPNQVLITGVNHLEYVLHEILYHYPYLSVDTETSSLDSFNGHMLAFGIYPCCKWDGDTLEHDDAYIIPKELLLGDPKILQTLHWMFTSGVWKFIWFNGKFDVRWFWRVGVKAKIDEDALMCAYAHNEAAAGGLDLETTARDLLDAPDYKDEVKAYLKKKSDSFELLPPEVLHKRLALDVLNTAGVWGVLRRRMDEQLHKLVDKTLCPASNMLARVEENGICVDLAVVDANETRLLKATSEAEEAVLVEAQKILGPEQPIGSLNLNSPADVSHLLYDLLGITIKNRRPPNTRKEVLAKVVDHPVVRALLKYRKTFKSLSTYVYPLRRRAQESVDGRVHTTYVLHRTPTGRLASKEPNVQNIPRDPMLRGMLCAPPGRILLEADYNSAELRMLAVASGDAFLTAIFLDDKRNLHDEVSIEMYGPNFTADQRIRAKAINFGIPYGREAYSIAEEFEMPTIEAQALIDRWFNTAPGAEKFILRCRNAPQSGITIFTVFGRKLRPGVVSAERLHERQNQFANFPMQSPISDFTLHSGMELEDPLWQMYSLIVNLVHDSLVFEVPDHMPDILDAARLIKGVMEGVPRKWVTTDITFKVEFKYGKNWGMGILPNGEWNEGMKPLKGID